MGFAAVLLTDGQGDYTNEAAQHANRDWRIFIVGQGSGVGENLLRQISTDTGGQYYALSDPDQFLDVYFDILGLIADATTVLELTAAASAV